MRVLTIIPARSGSKRCPGKNWEEVGGISLVERAVEHAVGDVVVVTDTLRHISCTGWIQIMQEPKELAMDDVRMVRVVAWTLGRLKERNNLECDAVVLLQPTSPFRTREDVEACVESLENNDFDSVVSVVGVKEGKHVRYEHNGAIYVTRPYLVERGEIIGGVTGFYVMPPERSIDIDTPEDLAEARRLAGD